MYMNYEINYAYLLIQKEKMHLISFYEIVFFKHYSFINLKRFFFCHLFKSRAKVFSMWIVKDITLKRKKNPRKVLLKRNHFNTPTRN